MYSQAIVDEVCSRLAEGESLRQICRDPEMPSYATVRRWEMEDEAFRALSARAREIGCHALADECLEIADEKEADAQRSRLRIDTRMRLIGKWLPKVYGDKVTQEHTGPNGGPVRIVATDHDESL